MITYEEYLAKGYADNIPQAEFNYIERIVKRRINYLTFNRFNYDNEEHIKYYNDILLSVMLELTRNGLLNENKCEDDANTSQAIKSETVGQYKIEYAVGTSYQDMAQDKKDAIIENKIDRIIKEYLGHTGLMYRGIL